MQGLSLTYQELLSKNNLRIQVKLATENSYLRMNIPCFDKLKPPIKFEKKSMKVPEVHKLAFLEEGVPVLLFYLLLVKFSFVSFNVFFVFDWNRKGFIKK